MDVRVFSVACAALMLCACAGTRSPEAGSEPLGTVSREQLGPAFEERVSTEQVPPEFIEMIRQVHDDVDFLVFLGFWCSDSHREVPRFLKIADESGIPARRITIIALDRKKTSPDGLERQYGIERVPTFVALKKGKEIGRIVESPRTTLEGDLLTILASSGS